MVKEFLVSKENKPSYECMNTAELVWGWLEWLRKIGNVSIIAAQV